MVVAMNIASRSSRENLLFHRVIKESYHVAARNCPACQCSIFCWVQAGSSTFRKVAVKRHSGYVREVGKYVLMLIITLSIILYYA